MKSLSHRGYDLLFLLLQGIESGGYNRGYLTNGEKWRPKFDWAASDAGSEKSHPGSKYIMLREDSTSSAYSFNQHYQTIRAIDHPHALMMGGFGETDTDMTLPRHTRKKSSLGSLSSMQELDENVFNTVKLDNNKNKVKLNGMIPHSSAPDSGRGSSESSPPSPGEEDRRSVVTMERQDSVLDTPGGVLNPVFDDNVGELCEPAAVPRQPWHDSLMSMPPGSSDSLLSRTDMHLFAYENRAVVPDEVSISSKASSLVAPPLQFRDSDPSIAVVKPSVIKQYGATWLHPDSGRPISNGHVNGAVPSAKPSPGVSPLAQPPPTAKPQTLSVSNLANSHDQSSGDNPYVVRRSFLHKEPPPVAQKPSAHVEPHIKTVRLWYQQNLVNKIMATPCLWIQKTNK